MATSPPERMKAFDTKMWDFRARGSEIGGYEKLGWVYNDGLLQPFIDLGKFTGQEVVVDVGTGSLAVLRTVAPYAQFVFGFDISSEMINRGSQNFPKNSEVFVADGYKIPLTGNGDSGVADVVTTRMVYHHLEDVGAAVVEAKRILKPDGRLIVSEYVAPDEETLDFDNQGFQMKEPGRHLWTGKQLEEMVSQNWGNNPNTQLHYAMLKQYSVRDWMGKSGLPEELQAQVLTHYLNAPNDVVAKMRISITGKGQDRDALIDRLFAFVVATK